MGGLKGASAHCPQIPRLASGSAAWLRRDKPLARDDTLMWQAFNKTARTGGGKPRPYDFESTVWVVGLNVRTLNVLTDISDFDHTCTCRLCLEL